MARDFEERLRQSLQARADDVTPDPALYREVQRRIRRGRFLRWSLAGAGAVAVVAVAALTVPSVLDRRIEFDPAPVATQPPTEEHSYNKTEPAGVMPVPEGMVFTDGLSAYSMALDGESATTLVEGDAWIHCPPPDGNCAGDPAVTSVTVGPASSFDSLAFVYDYDNDAFDHGCDDLGWGLVNIRDGAAAPQQMSSILTHGACPTAPAFSPDGAHLAWATEPGGEWFLSTVDWTADGPGEDDATFALPWGAGATDVSIEEWVWTSVDPDGATGYLVIAARIGEHVETYRRDITRQSDGALSLVGDHALPMGGEDGATPVAFADAKGAPDDPRVSYSLDVVRADEDSLQGSVVRRVDDREDGAFELPPELFKATGPPFDVSDLWLEAMGDTVLYGDGHGMAWRLTWNGSGWDGPFLLEATIVHADLFVSADATPPPEPEATTVAVNVFFDNLKTVTPCDAPAAVERQVEPPGVARGALTALLAGPTSQESNLGYSSPFGAGTADALSEIRIEQGTAYVDLRDFTADVGHDPGTACSITAALDATLLQFPSVERVEYSFDGDREAFLVWGYAGWQPPEAVQDTADRIRAAAEARDYDALREVIDPAKLSCSFSDSNDEDCIAVWQRQERRGEDPLGVMAELLAGNQAKNPNAPIWAWPVEYIVSDDYLGPRLGIDEDGAWRFFVLGGD